MTEPFNMVEQSEDLCELLDILMDDEGRWENIDQPAVRDEVRRIGRLAFDHGGFAAMRELAVICETHRSADFMVPLEELWGAEFYAAEP